MFEIENVTDGRLLTVKDLRVTHSRTGRVLVDDISFTVGRGETIALVGESGSGKSLTAKALVGLLPEGIDSAGSAVLGQDDLLGVPEHRLRALRGSSIGMLLQDPFTMLNPLIRVETIIGETLLPTAEGRSRRSKAEIAAEVDRRLAEVGIRTPGAARRYPWEFSGGMRQRTGLAAAIAKDPVLLVADEPTTALDATTQRETLRLLRDIQEARGMGLLLITHDLRVAFSMADRILVMRHGTLVEQGTPSQLSKHQETEYTQRLLAAELPLHERLAALAGDEPVPQKHDSPGSPRPGTSPVRERAQQAEGRGELLLRVQGLQKSFAVTPSDPETWALKGINVDLRDGVNVGVIGESGSGKTTFARCLLGLETPTGGVIEIGNVDVGHGSSRTRRHSAHVRSLVQCVFQDPYSSLNPAHKIRFILREAIRLRVAVGGSQDDVDADAEILRLLEDVGLPSGIADRLPATMSGGQRQRVAIARALAMQPKVLICDEPVAALDLTVQAQVLEVLRDVQSKGVNLLFITHDLPVVRQMTDELVVLHRGRVVERGRTADVIDNPQHDYTRRLVAAVPTGRSDWITNKVPTAPAQRGTRPGS